MKRSGPIKRRSRIRRVSKKGASMKVLLGLWSKAVIAAEGARCRAEGEGRISCGGPLNAHHIYGRGAYPAMKYDVLNGIPCCAYHHLYWVERQPPMVLLPWLLRELGHERLDYLRLEAARRTKMGKLELSELMTREKSILAP